MHLSALLLILNNHHSQMCVFVYANHSNHTIGTRKRKRTLRTYPFTGWNQTRETHTLHVNGIIIKHTNPPHEPHFPLDGDDYGDDYDDDSCLTPAPPPSPCTRITWRMAHPIHQMLLPQSSILIQELLSLVLSPHLLPLDQLPNQRLQMEQNLRTGHRQQT